MSKKIDVGQYFKKRYETECHSIKEKENQGIYIDNMALDLLEERGFDRKQKGTIYLSDIVATLYHEREAYQEDDPFVLYDFDNPNNTHYDWVNEYYECGRIHLLEEIDKSIASSYLFDKKRMKSFMKLPMILLVNMTDREKN